MSKGDTSKEFTGATSQGDKRSKTDKFIDSRGGAALISAFGTVAIGAFCFLPEDWKDKIRSKFDTPGQG